MLWERFMNDLKYIPCVIMRGGTSRGPFFLASDLPKQVNQRDNILLSIMGAGHPLQIDGIGGGNPVTNKVAIVGPATVPNADVDYLFAQIRNLEGIVDTSPNCGNMLSAVGPFAIEAGLVYPTEPVTFVKIHNINTGEIIEAEVPVVGNAVCYNGTSAIDGVPGTGAGIYLNFLNSANGDFTSLFPTGKTIEVINGITVTCINSAIPLVLIDPAPLNVTAHETAQELNANKHLIDQIAAIRQEAGLKMGLGDVRNKVIPKPVLLSSSKKKSTINARYFMPDECHPSLATTGAVGIAVATTIENTLASQLSGKQNTPTDIIIDHPSGSLSLTIRNRDGRNIVSLLRTTRRIFQGAALLK